MKRECLQAILRDLLLNIPEVGLSEFGAVRYANCRDTSTVIHPLSIFASVLRVLSKLDDDRLGVMMNVFRTASASQPGRHGIEDLHARTRALNKLNKELLGLPYGRTFLESLATKMIDCKLPFDSEGERNLAGIIAGIQRKQQESLGRTGSQGLWSAQVVDDKAASVDNPWSPLLRQFIRTKDALHQVINGSQRRQLEIERIQRSITTSLAAIGNDWDKIVAESTTQDNFAMIILAVLGSIFLPATFISVRRHSMYA